jgi:hypothetical protein
MVGALVGITLRCRQDWRDNFSFKLATKTTPIEDPKVVTFHELWKWKANINAFSLGGKRL